MTRLSCVGSPSTSGFIPGAQGAKAHRVGGRSGPSFETMRPPLVSRVCMSVVDSLTAGWPIVHILIENYTNTRTATYKIRRAAQQYPNPIISGNYWGLSYCSSADVAEVAAASAHIPEGYFRQKTPLISNN